jgi:hypothetical protein
MRRHFNPRFIRKYEAALKLYLEGYWPEAKQTLDDVERIKGYADKPTQLLIKFMQKNNYIVPDDWQCYRSMDSK